MNLNKIIVAFFLIIFTLSSQAQKNVYGFSYENKFGLTDSIGTEIIAPIHDGYKTSKNKEVYTFETGYGLNKKTLLYTVETGETNNEYKYISLDNVMIDGQSYHDFYSRQKSFHLNSETNEILKTKENIQSLDNLGSDYLIAKFRPTENEFAKPVPKRSPNQGNDISELKRPDIPPHDFDLKAYAIYNNNLPLKAVLKIEAHSFLLLYEKEAENNEHVQPIKPLNTTAFDYLAFRKDEQLFLYDKNIKLLKKLTYPKTEEKREIDKRYVQTEVSKFLDKQVIHTRSIIPDMAMDSSSEEEKKIGAFEVKKSTDGQYELIRRSDGKVCFSTPFEMKYSPIYNLVWVTNESRASSRLSIDKETGKPFLPKKYMDLLKIQVEN